MATPQGVLLGFFPKLQLWHQVSIIRLPYYLQRYLLTLCFDSILERLMTSSVI